MAWPFIGPKTLTEQQREHNDVHGFYRACIEHLFARMWHWGIIRNIWRGSSNELHEYLRVPRPPPPYPTKAVSNKHFPFGPFFFLVPNQLGN